ncbi:MAG: hypothetical protein CMF45_02535 [Legionellales bacterium]|nr:hypothetical protein [Legionellales bacterium]
MKYIKIGILVSLFASPYNVIGSSWYQVEVIVFERLNPYLDGEKWQDGVITTKDDAVELQVPDINNKLVPYMILNKSRNQLNGVEKVLNSSSEYKLLIHLSWQQPATQRKQSRYVHLQRLDGTSSTLETNIKEIEDEPDFIDELISSNKIIDGTIRVRSGFYLHADIDFSYFKNLPYENKILRVNEESFIGTSDKYVINHKETRKIKLDEIHYFDHPMLGLILQVSRLDIEN